MNITNISHYGLSNEKFEQVEPPRGTIRFVSNYHGLYGVVSSRNQNTIGGELLMVSDSWEVAHNYFLSIPVAVTATQIREEVDKDPQDAEKIAELINSYNANPQSRFTILTNQDDDGRISIIPFER